MFGSNHEKKFNSIRIEFFDMQKYLDEENSVLWSPNVVRWRKNGNSQERELYEYWKKNRKEASCWIKRETEESGECEEEMINIGKTYI